MRQLLRSLPLVLALLLPGARSLGAQTAAAAPPAAAPAAAAPAPQEVGASEGVVAARAMGTGMWTVGGFAGGLLLGPVGSGLAYALAGSSASSLPEPIRARIAKRDPDYQLAYQESYTERLTRRRRASALAGGAAGSTLFLAAAAVLLTR